MVTDHNAVSVIVIFWRGFQTDRPGQPSPVMRIMTMVPVITIMAMIRLAHAMTPVWLAGRADGKPTEKVNDNLLMKKQLQNHQPREIFTEHIMIAARRLWVHLVSLWEGSPNKRDKKMNEMKKRAVMSDKTILGS
jgi:hypothetical protein